MSSPATPEALVAQITAAFADIERPGDWALVNSTEGYEPAEIAKALEGVTWQALDAKTIDALQPLAFLSDEAFRYFLPAHLIAAVRGTLRTVDTTFYVTHGLEAESRDEPVNPRRYGARTWADEARHRFAVFKPIEAAAIVAYLEHIAATDAFSRERVTEALDGYWRARAAGPSQKA